MLTLPQNYKVAIGSKLQSWRLQRILFKHFGMKWGFAPHKPKFLGYPYLIVQIWPGTDKWIMSIANNTDAAHCTHETISSKDLIAKCKALIKGASRGTQ